MQAPLKIASEDCPDIAEAQPLHARVQRLRAETRLLVREHVNELMASLLRVEQIAAEIAAGGVAYPTDARDLAGRLRDLAAARVQTLGAIMARF